MTLNNAMGGETAGFATEYTYTTYGGTPYTLTYTASNAGAKAGDAPAEGWTVGGDAWVSGEPEVWYDGTNWRLYDPDWFYAFSEGTSFTEFVNADKTQGITFTGCSDADGFTIYPV